MGVLNDGDDRGHWPRVLAAAGLIVVPVLVLTVLVFGGGQVASCLGPLGGCQAPPRMISEGLVPAEVVIALAVALVALWLIVVGLTIGYLWSADRGRLLRGIGCTLVVVAATALATGLVRLSEGRRLRDVAEDAALYALGVALILVPIVMAWAIVTARRRRVVSTTGR